MDSFVTPPNPREDDEAALLPDLIRQSQDALVIRDFDGVIRYLSPAAEALYGYSIDEARGRNIHELFQNQFPAGREKHQADLLRDGFWSGEILQRRRDGTEIVVSSRQTLLRGKDGRTDVVLASNRDVTDQYRAAHRLQRLFDSHVVGVIYWNLDTGQITDANDHFLQMVGYSRDDLAAGLLNFRAMTPPEWTERNEIGVAAIRAHGSAPTYEKEYFRKDGSRVPILIGGTRFEESGTEGFSFIIDITDLRGLRAEQERLFEELRTRADREAILSGASRALNASLDYQETLSAVARLIVPRFADWCAVDILDHAGVPQRVAIEHVDPKKAAWGWELNRLYPARMDDERGIAKVLRSGEPSFTPHITDDMLVAAIRDPERLRLMLEIGFTSAMTVPLAVRENVFGAISLIATQESGRIYSEEDLRFAQEIGQRAAFAVENARLFRATQQRAQQESLLNRIGDAIRTTLDPESMLRATVAALGEGMGADRCYFARYSPAWDIARANPEWIRSGAHIHSIADRDLFMSTFAVNRDDRYRAGTTQVVNDVLAFSAEDAAPLIAVDIRSLLRVPMEVGDAMSALCVSMAFEPRQWTTDEVRLVENVTSLLHAALESARVRQREHKIAEQLQAALFPTEPPLVPGLSLAHFYRPALEEAGVGGDYFEVAPIDEGRTALIVADLSGKGLAAASQVALVRNMLRFALYNSSKLADAVTTLHTTLVERDLLTGFATLFVGLFEHTDQTLTYVNCGQEPTLIWRAESRDIERLGPTGPVLGGFAADGFEQRTIRLYDGDFVAIFTDGLTEAGPSRKNFLEIEGICALFAEQCDRPSDELSAQSVLQKLISEVDQFARGGRGDDIALLVGKVSSAR